MNASQRFVAKFHAEHPEVECMGCYHLRSMGIKCNVHRTESSAARILRLADEAGLVTTDVFEAEKALGLKPVYI